MSHFADLSVAFDNFSSTGMVVPQWEWKLCATLTSADAREAASLARLKLARSHTHLLGIDSQHSVTLSNDWVYLRSLDSVDQNGVELWCTSRVQAFPLTPDFLDEVRTALGGTTAPLIRGDQAGNFVFDVLREMKSVRIVQARHQVFMCVVWDCDATVELISVANHMIGCITLRHRDARTLHEIVHACGVANTHHRELPTLLKQFLLDGDHRRIFAFPRITMLSVPS